MQSVYLAGPISGLDYQGATGWREEARIFLENRGIRALSPMRGKKFLKDVTSFSATCENYGGRSVLASPKGIMTRDRYDATHCDVLLVNFLGAKTVSIGTCMEVAWADGLRTPIVAVMEEGNVHEHAMITEAIGYRVDTLKEALEITTLILGGV